MSSFICSEKDFNRVTKLVVKGLNLCRDSRSDFWYGIKDDLEEAFGIKKEFIETNKQYVDAINNIYKQIKKMNYDAVFCRYKEDYTIEFKEVRPMWFTGIPTHQDFKTLQCYLYQCCEGDVPETKLYKVLRKLEYKVATYIIENQQEYEEAEWGEQDEDD